MPIYLLTLLVNVCDLLLSSDTIRGLGTVHVVDVVPLKAVRQALEERTRTRRSIERCSEVGRHVHLPRGGGQGERHVDGVAAGLSSPTGKIGFVAAKPIPSVLSNINSVLLGARSVNPNATVQVIFTGEWSLPVREAEATNALIDAGCDVVTCHLDAPYTCYACAKFQPLLDADHREVAVGNFVVALRDERETLIQWRSHTVGYYVLMVLVLVPEILPRRRVVVARVPAPIVNVNVEPTPVTVKIPPWPAPVAPVVNVTSPDVFVTVQEPDKLDSTKTVTLDVGGRKVTGTITES